MKGIDELDDTEMALRAPLLPPKKLQIRHELFKFNVIG